MVMRRDEKIRSNPSRPLGYFHNPDNLPQGIDLNTWLSYTGASADSNLAEIWLNRNTYIVILTQSVLKRSIIPIRLSTCQIIIYFCSRKGQTLNTWLSYTGASADSNLAEIWLNRLAFSTTEIDNYPLSLRVA